MRKRIISVVLSLTLLVTSLTYTPQTADADAAATGTNDAQITVQNDTKSAFDSSDGTLKVMTNSLARRL